MNSRRKCCCESPCVCCTAAQFKSTVLATISGVGLGTCVVVGPGFSGNSVAYTASAIGFNTTFCLESVPGNPCQFRYEAAHTTTTLEYTPPAVGANCGDPTAVTITSNFIQLSLDCFEAESNTWCVSLFVLFDPNPAETEGDTDLGSTFAMFSKLFVMVCGDDTTTDNEITDGTGYSTCRGDAPSIGSGGSISLAWGAC